MVFEKYLNMVSLYQGCPTQINFWAAFFKILSPMQKKITNLACFWAFLAQISSPNFDLCWTFFIHILKNWAAGQWPIEIQFGSIFKAKIQLFLCLFCKKFCLGFFSHFFDKTWGKKAKIKHAETFLGHTRAADWPLLVYNILLNIMIILVKLQCLRLCPKGH